MNWTRVIFAQVVWASMYFILTAFVQWDWLWYEAVGEWSNHDRALLILPYVLVATFVCAVGLESDK